LDESVERSSVQLNQSTSSEEIKRQGENAYQMLNSVVNDPLVAKLLLLSLVSYGNKRDSNGEPADMISLNVHNIPENSFSTFITKTNDFLYKILPSFETVK